MKMSEDDIITENMQENLPELDLKDLDEKEEEVVVPERIELPENIEPALDKIRDWFNKLFLNGVQRISKDNIEELQALSITAHTIKVARLERDIQSMSKILELYLKKDPTFNFTRLTSTLSRISITAKTINDYKEGKELPLQLIKLLTGVKDAKQEFDLMIAQTLGLSGWMTDSGYVGVTAYLYDLTNKRIITATNARPLTSLQYMNNRRSRYGGYRRSRRSSSNLNSELKNIVLINELYTNSNIKIKDFASSAFQIRNGKISNDYPAKLSLGKYLRVHKYKAIPWTSTRFQNIRYDDWNEVHVKIQEVESEGNTLFPQIFGLFKIKAFSPMEHDEVEKLYKFKAYDKSYNSMNVVIPDKGRNQYAIETFKDLFLNKTFPSVIFGQARIGSDGNLSLWPISGIWNKGLMLSNFTIIRSCDFTLNKMRFKR